MEKAREFLKNIYFCFIDYAKAFDFVDHNKLWKILKEMGIPVRSRIRHYLQNGGTAPGPSPHSTGLDPGYKALGLVILTCLFLSLAELTEKQY